MIMAEYKYFYFIPKLFFAAPHRSPRDQPKAGTSIRQICQHLEHGSQDDHRSCIVVSQVLKYPDIPEGQPRISAYSQAEGSQPKTAAMTASGAW